MDLGLFWSPKCFSARQIILELGRIRPIAIFNLAGKANIKSLKACTVKTINNYGGRKDTVFPLSFTMLDKANRLIENFWLSRATSSRTFISFYLTVPHHHLPSSCGQRVCTVPAVKVYSLRRRLTDLFARASLARASLWRGRTGEAFHHITRTNNHPASSKSPLSKNTNSPRGP